MECSASYHIFGSCISHQDTKIQFNFKPNLTSAIGNFSKLRHLASYVSRHNAMAYDRNPIHGDGCLLLHLALPGNIIQHEDLLPTKADDNIFL